MPRQTHSWPIWCAETSTATTTTERGGVRKALAGSGYGASDLVAEFVFYAVAVPALGSRVRRIDLSQTG
jgi:hypothetical protein